MKFSIKVSEVNVTKSEVPTDLVTFTEEILNGKHHFLCSESLKKALTILAKPPSQILDRVLTKYGVYFGPYFPVFSPNTGKYELQKLRIWTLFTKLYLFPAGLFLLKVKNKNKTIE